jgi:hypothetical protein
VFELMTSTQLALVIRSALVVTAALVITAAQLRVLRAPPPRRWRYVTAWLACTLLLGALAIYLDTMVGITAIGDRLLSLAGAGVLVAVGLAAGAWWTRRPDWPRYNRLVAVVSLFVIEVLIALAALSVR